MRPSTRMSIQGSTNDVPRDRTYLEDVGRKVSGHGGANLWLVENLTKRSGFEHLDLPDKIYVVDFPGNGPGQELLLGRQIAGLKKFNLIRQTTYKMVGFMVELFVGKVGQFIILWGGRSQDLIYADPPVFEEIPDSMLIKLQRRFEGKEGNKKLAGIDIIGINGDWWLDDTVIAMEECIASGSTLLTFVKLLLENHAQKGFKPQKIFVFPVCGSLEGIIATNQLCRENGVEFIPVFNSALIELAEKGVELPVTDLGLRPKTIVSKEFFMSLYPRYQGLPICWVGDIGLSFHNIRRHCQEFIRDMRVLGADPHKEKWHKWPAEIHKPEFREWLNQEHPDELEYLLPVADKIWTNGSH